MPGDMMIAALFLGLGPTMLDPGRAEVLAVVEAAFAGIAAKDEAAIRAQLRPTGTATVIMEKVDGSRTVRSVELAAWASVNPGPERYKEQMVAPTVAIDGAIATVSGRYTFAVDGTVRHCGYQHFDLVRDAGVWKIQNVTWSVRTFGCGTTRPRRK
jgi:hypothetical protein